MEKQIKKMFFVSEIIGSEESVLNCLYEEENSFQRQ